MVITVYSILWICLIISIVQLLKALFDGSTIVYNNSVNDIIKQRDLQVRRSNNLRIGLIVTELKMLYFSYLYFSLIDNLLKIRLVQQQLLGLSIDERIVYDIISLGKFVNKVDSNQILIVFDDHNRKIYFKERLEKK